MAGILKVDQLQSDSNLALKIASANVAFVDSTGLRIVGNNLNLANTNVISSGKLLTTAQPTGAVLQVVSTDYTSTFTTTSTSPVDITGFSATITPTSASSKILVMVSVFFGGAYDIYPYVLLKRNGTSLSTGTSASGDQKNVFLGGYFTAISSMIYGGHQASKNYLDSPATTSALTYQMQLAHPYQISGTAYINRQENQQNNSFIQFPTSTITLMEIAG
jgi:hypothetical protein